MTVAIRHPAIGVVVAVLCLALGPFAAAQEREPTPAESVDALRLAVELPAGKLRETALRAVLDDGDGQLRLRAAFREGARDQIAVVSAIFEGDWVPDVSDHAMSAAFDGPPTHLAAASLLREIGTQAAIDALIAGLAHTSPHVQRECASALGYAAHFRRNGDPDDDPEFAGHGDLAAAVPALQALAARRIAGVTGAACRALARFETTAADAALAAEGGSLAAEMEVAVGLRGDWPRRQVFGDVTDCFPYGRESVLAAFRRMDERFVPLLQQIGRASNDGAARAASALGLLRTPRAIDALINGGGARRSSRRDWCLDVIGEWQMQRAVVPLAKLLADAPGEPLPPVCRALARIGSPEATVALEHHFDGLPVEQKVRAIYTLAWYRTSPLSDRLADQVWQCWSYVRSDPARGRNGALSGIIEACLGFETNGHTFWRTDHAPAHPRSELMHPTLLPLAAEIATVGVRHGHRPSRFFWGALVDLPPSTELRAIMRTIARTGPAEPLREAATTWLTEHASPRQKR